MAYVKNTWVDQKVQRPKTYNFTNNDDGSTTLIDAFGNVEELGTPVNADNMNHIEDGLSTVGMWVYSKTVEYNKDDAVISVVEDKFVLYKSKQNNNKGNALDNKEFWEEVSLGGGGNAGLSLFDIVEKDHILTFKESNGLAQLGTYVYKTAIAGSRYGYPSFYNQCVKEKNAGTATQTQLGDNTVTLYKNDNGHIFYDIADKDAIDAWYNIYGVAWYYGVDTANERIFLPRNDWFTQNGSTTEVGKFVEAGLPNITGGDLFYESGFTNFEGAIYNSGTGQGSKGSMDNDNPVGKFDASKSNAIYGKSTTVQPNAVKKLFYMCVGNTDVESAITDVIDITTSENDTIPLGWSTYQKDGTPTSAFLASLGQQNSGKLYSSFFNTYAPKIGQKFGAGTIKEAHTVFDLSKFTIVGSPMISDDGVASGFSSSNYLTAVTSISDTSTNVEVVLKNIVPSSFSDIHNVFLSFTLSNHPLRFSPKGRIGMFLTSWRDGVSTYNVNDSVDIKLIYNNNTITLYSKLSSSNTYIKEVSHTSTTNTIGGTFYIGINATNIKEFLNGSIDLKSFSITVDGEEVFNGTKTVMPDDVTDYDLVINQNDQTFRLPLLNGDESIPDNDAIISLTPTDNFSYTAPQNGTITLINEATQNIHYIYLNGNQVAVVAGGGVIQDSVTTTLLLKKGDVLTSTLKPKYVYFIPVVGNGTLYYKVSNAVQNLQLLDVAEVTTALANKVDTSNTQWATNACMPDYSAGISVTYPLSSNPYTAPCNGMLCPWGKPSNTAIKPIINGVKQEYLRLGELSGDSGGFQGRSYVLSKGDVIYFDTSYDRLNGCVFYPLKGAK